MDLLTPLPLTESGNKHLVAFQCSFTKYVMAVPLKDKTAQAVAEALVNSVVLTQGTPETLLSDNGSEFCNELMSNICDMLSITRKTCNPYTPSTDGMIERFFGTYSGLMSTVINHKQTDWDKLTNFVLHAYNNTTHSSTGFTPTYLAFGREIEIPFEACIPIAPPFSYNDNKDYFEITRESLATGWIIAKDHIQSAQNTYKYYHDLRSKGHQYQEHDVVYVYVPRIETGKVKKFSRLYQGPYIITKLRGLNAYVKTLNLSGEPTGVEFLVHLQRLKKARMPHEIKSPATYVSKQTSANTPPNQRTTTTSQTATSPATPNHSYNLRRRTN
jgi:hypothetical protein